MAQHATKLEVKYEELREKYDTDLHELIELRLKSAEDRAKLAEYQRKEQPTQQQQGQNPFGAAPSAVY